VGDLDVSKFITQERMADETLQGQTTYPFHTALDLGALLNDPAVQAGHHNCHERGERHGRHRD